MNMEEGCIFNYAPSAETAVYLLLGLLWDYIPHKFIFNEFEVDPNKAGYEFKKYVDARGKEWKEGKWIDVNFEFKLKSSGLLKDVQKYPRFKPDWLICWIHDAKAAENYTKNILCLYDVYKSIPDNEKGNIMKNPEENIKLWDNTSNMDELLTRYSPENKEKVNLILDKWKEYNPGNSEILLTKRGSTIARICSYSREYLLFQKNREILNYITKRYKTIKKGDSIHILLENLNKADIIDIINKMKEEYS